ncbi:hypothetical protein [Streptomyces sp. NPDC042319]|uniref:hypothetical protein n=1 Tax=Streptomyces sp. NPDC042319 TaxID=3154332 RepID=UPI0033D11C1E
MDTCEHLAEACAEPLTELVGRCPGLHVLIRPKGQQAATYRMPWPTRAHGRQWLSRLGEEPEFRRRCLAWLLRDT